VATASPSPPDAAQKGSPRRRWSLRNASAPTSLPPATSLPQLANHHRLRLQLEAQRTARLWNPSNSTPRSRRETRGTGAKARARAESGASIAQPAVALRHPQLAKGGIGGEPRTGGDIEFIGGGSGKAHGGDYPLLSLREQRQSRNSSARASLQVEYSASSGTQSNRVSLPRSVKSIDIRRSLVVEERNRERAAPGSRDKGKGKEIELDVYARISTDEKPTGYHKHSQPPSTSHPPIALPQNPKNHPSTNRSLTHPFTTATMPDLERGTITQHPSPSSGSFNGGGLDGLVPALAPHADSFASSDTSMRGSMRGSMRQAGGDAGSAADEWGPAHPCFPHPNVYVAAGGAEAEATRVIRVRRDWMAAGDLAPAFAEMYPELLGEAGLGEAEFRRCVQEVNARLARAFDPFGLRNVVDVVLGLCTGWLWDDTGLTYTKRSLAEVERLLQGWNGILEKEGATARWVSLRKSAYMSVSVFLFLCGEIIVIGG